MSGGGCLGPSEGPPRRSHRPENSFGEATPHAPSPGRRHHPAAPHEDHVSHVLLYECCPEGEVRVHSLLEQEGYELTACEDGEQLLEAAMKQRPDAVVYVFKKECSEDLGVLQLLRRLAPTVPIVVLANATSLRLQRLVQHLRPIYYAVAPVDPVEIRSAVQSALNRRSSAAGA